MDSYTPSRGILLGFSVIPVLGILGSAVVEAGISPSAPAYGPLMLVGYLLSYVGVGAVFFLWAMHFRQNGRPAIGDAFVRGIFLVMVSFVGWSLVLKYLPISVSSVAVFEAIIVATAAAGTGLLIVWSTDAGVSVLLSKEFGVTIGITSLAIYVLYLIVSHTVTVYTVALALALSIIVGRHLVPLVAPAA